MNSMSEKDYKEYRKLFVGLSESDAMRLFFPHTKEECDFSVGVMRKMKNFEREHGHPGKWFDTYKGDYKVYKSIVLTGEYSKEGCLWDRL